MLHRPRTILRYSIIVFLVSLTSCTAYVDAFNVTVEDTIIDYQPKLKDVNKRSGDAQSYVIQNDRPFIYVFDPALSITKEHAVFVLRYTADFPDARLMLFDNESLLYAAELSTPALGVTMEHVVPLQQGMRITSYQIEAKGLRIKELILAKADTEAADTVSRFSPSAFSYYNSDVAESGYLSVPSGWRLHTKHDTLVLEFPETQARLANGAFSILHLNYDAKIYAPALPLSVESTATTASYEYDLRPGPNDVYIPLTQEAVQMALGFAKNSFTDSFNNLSISIEMSPPFPNPIAAGLDTLVNFPRQLWRNQDYELFSWSLYPNILILFSDTLATQARFFKRLAFFVEKRGYRGRLLSNAVLSSRHGWNAHNYRAEDIAHFFNQVEAQDSKLLLNPEELELKDILLQNAIIIHKDGRYLSGRGGILGVAANVSHTTLKKLLGHEALHGVFYEEEEYRRVVHTLWNNLTEAERTFWRFMLNTLSYDSSDRYLATNEFHAYLLQQGVDEVSAYYNNIMKARLQRFSTRDGYIANAIKQYNFEAHAIYLQKEFFSKKYLIGSTLSLMRMLKK